MMGKSNAGQNAGQDDLAPEQPRRQPRRQRRRDAGEGHVRKLPSGRWNGEIMLGYRERRDEKGRTRLVRAVYSVTRARRVEVEAELARLRDSFDHGTLAASDRLTLGDLFDRWLRDHIRVRRAEGTLKTYRSVVEAQLRPRMGDLPLRRLSTLRLVQEINRLGDQPPEGLGHSPATVAKAWATLHGALTWATRVHLLERHPLQGLEGPPKGDPGGRVLAPAEVVLLREAATRHRGGQWAPLVDLLVFTGMRIGEALSLTWSDVDLPDALVTVRVSKSRRGRRHISLPPQAVAALRDQWRRLFPTPEDGDAAWAEGWAAGLPVFPSVLSATDPARAYSAWAAQQEFRRIVTLSGIRGRVTARDLRHTWNTTADRLRYGSRARAAHLGHTPQVNVATYTHEERQVQEEMSRAVAQALEAQALEG